MTMSNASSDPEPPASRGTLIGRDLETRELGSFIDAIDDHGGALLVRGEVGVGKSALLAAACEYAQASDIRVLRISGIASEASVPGAGLHQMVRPLLDKAGDRTRDQRSPVLPGLRMAGGASCDSFLMAVATLELMATVTESGPLLIAIDDAHWLDSSTAEVLGFVARRLDPEPMGLLMAVGHGYETALLNFGIPEIHVEALDEASAATLLDGRVPGLPPGFQARILDQAAGNPMALLGLSAVARADPAAVFEPPQQLELPEPLVRAFAERFTYLPARTQELLLLASADEHACLDDLLAAARSLPNGSPASIDDLSAAVTSGLIDQESSRITFRHPLLPAAIYHAVIPSQRRRAHTALADALVDHPGRRAWHRAALATGADDEVADELEASALNLAARPSPEASLASIERAAELTEDTSRRNRRLLTAAELAVDLGQTPRAAQLLRGIDVAWGTSLDRARVGLVRDMVTHGFLLAPHAEQTLLSGARGAISEEEAWLALRLLQAAALRSWWSDTEVDVRFEIVAAAERVASPDPDSDLALVVASIVAMCDRELGIEALNRVATRTAPGNCDHKTACAVGTALHLAGAYDQSAPFLAVAIAYARDHGAMWHLPQALTLQTWNIVFSADWNTATAEAEEAAVVSRALGQPLWEAFSNTALSVVAAIRGDEATAERHLGGVEALALPIGAKAVLADVQMARSVIAMAGGRYEEAFQHLLRTFNPNDPAHHGFRGSWRLAELAEAAVHSGHIDEARHQLERQARLESQRNTDGLSTGLLFARALLADDATAQADFEAAINAQPTKWPFYRARVLLYYGTWLRRHRRVAEARGPLRVACDSLEALGASPWAERARQELRASNEAHRNHPGSCAALLTERELQIARLVAEGLSNREVAQQLYMSPRTVGCHLYRIFPKLGIASRAQLRPALDNTVMSGIAS
jgi:DNA-binding CsgD family transcriptional regulator